MQKRNVPTSQSNVPNIWVEEVTPSAPECEMFVILKSDPEKLYQLISRQHRGVSLNLLALQQGMSMPQEAQVRSP
jgi:hypothetical protein